MKRGLAGLAGTLGKCMKAIGKKDVHLWHSSLEYQDRTDLWEKVAAYREEHPEDQTMDILLFERFADEE